MKAGTDTPARAASPSPRHTVRLFVAVHVAAVLAIYATALAIGGGYASPPVPPGVARKAAVAPAAAQRTPPMPGLVPAAGVRPTATVPAWTERIEVAAPWEGR